MSSSAALRLVVAGVMLLSAVALAGSPRLSEAQREQIIRAFLDEPAFLHRALPLGKAGVVIEGSRISPSEAEVHQLIQSGGALARPGERVRITGVRFVRSGILFEINGGARPHEKWADHIHIGMAAPEARSTQPVESTPRPPGSSILLNFADGAAITPDRVKTLLAPVLDFHVLSQAEADLQSLPPLLSAAIRRHRALVGMNRDMVLAAMGRPPRRLRETSRGRQYEEWIYGSPPREVQFIRFMSGKVVRIEEMKVTGEKLVRTRDEVGGLDGVRNTVALAGGKAAAGAAPAMAAPEPHNPVATTSPAAPGKPPTLLRPGERLPGENAPCPLPQYLPESPAN